MQRNNQLPMGDPAFQRIISFYLLQCPVVYPEKKDEAGRKKRVSQLGKTMQDYGWHASTMQKLTYYFRKQFDSHKLNQKEDVLRTYKTASTNSNNMHHVQFAFFKLNGKMPESASVLYYIRCALAHGAFERKSLNKRIVYLFESRNDKELKGIIQLNESTLLNWIDYIQAGPKKSEDLQAAKKRKTRTPAYV